MARETVESLCKKAQQALTTGSTDQARRFYEQAVILQHDSPDVHYGLATVMFLLNDLPRAAHHFKEVTKLDPMRAGAYINLGAVYNRLEQLDEAIPMLRRGIQLDMNRAEGYYNLGLVYRRKGQNDLAIQAYREATRINPRMADAHYNLGNLYLEKEQFGLAVAHYKQALEIRPGWEKPERGLAQAEEALAAGGGPKVSLQPTATPINRPVDAVSAPGGANLDPERTVDPNFHGAVLSSLHTATIDSDNHGRSFLKALEAEIEPAIKELSSCLLYPDSTATEVDNCLQKFTAAMGNMKTAQTSLKTSLERVRRLGEQLLKM